MIIDRLLRACGWTETPGTGPLTHDYDLAFAVVDPPRVERFATVIGHTAAATAAMRAAIAVRLATEGEAIVTVHRAGEGVFDVEVLDALAAAGVRVEETPDRVTLHMPSTGIELSGSLTAHDLFFPRDMPPPRSNQPDYLRHDPTKRHRRVRSKR